MLYHQKNIRRIFSVKFVPAIFFDCSKKNDDDAAAILTEREYNIMAFFFFLGEMVFLPAIPNRCHRTKNPPLEIYIRT